MFRLAYVLLLLLLTYQFVVTKATNSPSTLPREEQPPNCVDDHSQRTLFGIISGCISTTIICSLAAIHTDIPPREGPFKRALRRLEFMLWMVVAPEIFPAWALQQRLAAMTVRDIYNRAKGYAPERRGVWKTLQRWFSLYETTDVHPVAWTLKHGYFLIMGGIRLVDHVEAATGVEQAMALDRDSNIITVVPETTFETLADPWEPVTVYGYGNRAQAHIDLPERGLETILTLELLRDLVKDPDFEIEVTEDEITNRSKWDALSKAIVIFQLSWFIVQCLARWIQGLTLTLLELTTLALASLNGITYILWWDKPYSTQTLLQVNMKHKLTRVGDRGEMIQNHHTFLSDLWWVYLLPLAATSIFPPVYWLIQTPFYILLLLLFPIIAFSIALNYAIAAALQPRSSFYMYATHVPTFYVPGHQYSKTVHVFLFLMCGTIFGGILCAGWNFPFRSYIEQGLWRVISVAVTSIPIGLAFLSAGFKFINPIHYFRFTRLTIFVYVFARLLLFGQALAILRHLPPAAFTAVEWTKFYPHFE